MRRKKLAFVFGLLVLGGLVGAIATERVLKYGFSAHDEPTALEVMAARTARKLAAPQGVKRLRNPLPQTHENLAQGMEFWATSCAVCHGNNGSGRTTIGRNIYPKAPDMRLSATQNLSDGELYYTITNGIRLTAMPAWGAPSAGGKPDEQNENLWRLVQFVRHLPQLTPAEEQLMKRMNPRIPDESDRQQATNSK
jgi:mono/diheme cytochrome c family protein